MPMYSRTQPRETPTGLLWLGQSSLTHCSQPLLSSPGSPGLTSQGPVIYGGLVWLKTHSQSAHGHGAQPLQAGEQRALGEGPTGVSLCVARIGL